MSFYSSVGALPTNMFIRAILVSTKMQAAGRQSWHLPYDEKSLSDIVAYK